MLDENAIVVTERLKPMVLKALGEQSIGLKIVCWDLVCMPMDMGNGPRPFWCAYYQAAGIMPGKENYVGNMTAIGNPYVTQLELDNAIAEGMASLRKQRIEHSGPSLGRLN